MPNANRVFPAGTGGNPTSPILGTAADLSAQPPIRAPPDPFVLKSVEPFTDDDNVPGFVDGQGNRIWHVDTSASAKAITFVSAADSTDFSYVVKWTKGANGLVITSALGNVGGTTTFVGAQAGDAYGFRSDGIEYHLVTRVGDFVTSASFASQVSAGDFVSSNSLSVVLATADYVGSNSLSAKLVTLDYVSSNSLSLKDYVNSTSMSIYVAANVDFKKLGQTAIGNSFPVAAFSGSWTAYSIIEVRGFFNCSVSLGAQTVLNAYISTGTTRILSAQVTSASVPNGGNIVFNVQGLGNGATPGFKAMAGWASANKGASGSADLVQWSTATANSGFINEIGVFATDQNAAGTKTMSAGMIYVYGYK